MNTTQTAELYSHFKSGHDGDKDSEGSDCPSSSWTDECAKPPTGKGSTWLWCMQHYRPTTFYTPIHFNHGFKHKVDCCTICALSAEWQPCCVQAAGSSGQKTGTFWALHSDSSWTAGGVGKHHEVGAELNQVHEFWSGQYWCATNVSLKLLQCPSPKSFRSHLVSQHWPSLEHIVSSSLAISHPCSSTAAPYQCTQPQLVSPQHSQAPSYPFNPFLPE